MLPAGQGTAGTYRDSAHGGSNGVPAAGQGVLRSSLAATFAAGNCAHCHEQHASINGGEPDPVNLAPSSYLLFDDLAGNAICIYCHDNSVANGADNIASQISKSSRHDPNSALGSVLCNDCHDSHVAKNINHSEAVSGNAVSGSLLSVAGASVSSWPIPGNPPAGSDANLSPGTPTLNNIDPATMEYQICLKCHGGQAAYSGLADLRGQFNPNNYSLHPVTTNALNWKNAFLRGTPAALNAPWNANLNAQMYCSDCHGSDNSADPVGPHGSNNIYLLKLAGPGTTLDNLCTKCHNAIASSAWVEGPGNPNPLLTGDHTLAQHQYPTNPLGCLACHGGIGGPLVSNIHGANYLWPNYGANSGRQSKAFLMGGLITQNYFIGTDIPGNRYCASSCHTNDGGAGYSY